MFFEVILIIWFPSISILGQTALYTVLMYPIIIIAVIWNEHNKCIINDNIGIQYLKSVGIFVVLTIVGAVASELLSSNAYNDIKTLFSYIIWFFYAFVYYVLCNDPTIKLWIKYAIVLSAFTLGLYSVYSYFTTSNIYVDYFAIFFSADLHENQFVDYSDARGISFRVYGNLNNPVYFSGELMLLLAFSCYEFCYTNGKIYRAFLLLTIAVLTLGVIFTGSKSGIIPSFGILIYTFYNHMRKGRKTFRLILFFTCFAFIYSFLGDLINVDFNRFFTALNPFEENVAGSNAMHRSNQFEYIFKFIGDNFLFGNGIGWCRYYYTTHGIHPILHTFESIIMSSFAEGGIWGLLIVYPMFMIGLYRLKINHILFPYYRVMLLAFYFFIIATGMGMIKYFFVMVGVLINDYKSIKNYWCPIKN